MPGVMATPICRNMDLAKASLSPVKRVTSA
jgi:hypothetical protein